MDLLLECQQIDFDSMYFDYCYLLINRSCNDWYYCEDLNDCTGALKC